MVRDQQVSASILPSFAREDITSEVNLPYSITELRDMVASAEGKNEPDQTWPPGAAEVVRYMNESGDYEGFLHRLYWQVSPVVVNGVVEKIRTKVIELVSEMRSGMDRNEKIPSSDLASQAVNVVVKGDLNRVTVKNTQTSGHKTPDKGLIRRTLEIVAWIAGIVGTAFLIWFQLG